MKYVSNPWRLMLVVAFNNALFFIPTAIAYYQIKGTDIGSFLFLQGLFRIAILVLEVPTGYLADRWNRQSQLMAGSVLWVASMALLYSAGSFTGLLVAQIVGAASVSLRSGTVQAYLHETLRAEGNESEQAKWQGRLFAVPVATEMLAGLIGGTLFGIWTDAPVIATLICAILGVVVSAKLPFVARGDALRRRRNPFADLWAVVHHSLRIHPRLPWLLLGPWTMFGFTVVLFWSMQGQLTAIGTSPATLGYAFAAFMGIKTLMALLANRFHSLDRRLLLAGLVLLLIFGTCLILTVNPWLIWVGGVLSAGLVHAIGAPLANTLINAEVPDHERATVLSVANMINVLVGAVYMIGAQVFLNQVGITVLLLSYLGITLSIAGYPLWRMSQK